MKNSLFVLAAFGFLSTSLNAAFQLHVVHCLSGKSTSAKITLLQGEDSISVLADGTFIIRGKEITMKTASDPAQKSCPYAFKTKELEMDDDGVTSWVLKTRAAKWNVLEINPSRAASTLSCSIGTKIDSYDSRCEFLDGAKEPLISSAKAEDSIAEFPRECMR